MDRLAAGAGRYPVDAVLRETWVGGWAPTSRQNKKPPRMIRGGVLHASVKRYSVLGRPGSDLLFQALRLSTIGAEDFDGRVRDGIGYRLLAMTTRPAKDGTDEASDLSLMDIDVMRAFKPIERLVPVS